MTRWIFQKEKRKETEEKMAEKPLKAEGILHKIK